jgi:hypothetical protein
MGPGPMAARDVLAAWRGAKLGLRAHLVIFGLAIVIPALLYTAFVLSRYAQSVHASSARRGLETARALSADVDREITAIITTLETLATSRSLLYQDYADFHEQAKEALRSRPWNVALIGANRRQIVNTRVPWGTPLPASVGEPDVLRVAKETQQPYVSDLFFGSVAQRPIFTVSVPVRKGEAIPYALVMSLEPDRLVEILKGESLPPGWRAAVSDRNNINMARTQFANQYLGHPIPDDSVRQYAGRTEGVIETVDFEGQRSLNAFHWSRLTGWHVTAWAPFSVVEGQLRQAWVLFFWSGAVLLSLSVLLAFGAGS